MSTDHLPVSATLDSPSSASQDPVFLQGLQSILAPLYARGASEEEIADVTRRAESFYNQSKATALSSGPLPTVATPSSTSDSAAQSSTVPPPAPAPAPTGAATTDPPYPLSFATLASLIASGAPIPGIRDIPDKLAEGEPSVSHVDVGRVKKPWEREPEGDTDGTSSPLAGAGEVRTDDV